MWPYIMVSVLPFADCLHNSSTMTQYTTLEALLVLFIGDRIKEGFALVCLAQVGFLTLVLIQLSFLFAALVFSPEKEQPNIVVCLVEVVVQFSFSDQLTAT